MAARRGEARERILECAEALIKQHGSEAVSIEAVASAAGSAKGLVHYHFKTKRGLISVVAERIAEVRAEKWNKAFDAPSANAAVEQTWTLLTEESVNGTVKAWQSLVGWDDKLTDGLAKKLRTEFTDRLCVAFTTMLRVKLGLIPTISETELGQLLGVVVDGMGFQLTSGAEEHLLEGAYSVAWLGILSLTQPAA